MSEIDFHEASPMRTVCEVTREVMDIVTDARGKVLSEDVYQDIRTRLIECMLYQKKMDKRLREYKSDYAKMYKANPDFDDDRRKREAA